MGKIFKDRERIMRLFRMNNMNYTKKTYGNIRSFLETYMVIKPDIIYLALEKRNAVLMIEAPEIFKEMISSEIIPQEKIEEFIGRMMRSGHLQEMIDKSLSEVRVFSENGEVYYKILWHLYFDENLINNSELERKLAYSHTALQIRKELAIMLFGVVFWKSIQEYGELSADEMYRIEIEAGRDGSLAERRRTGERRKYGDRRSGLPDRRKSDRRSGSSGRVCPI